MNCFVKLPKHIFPVRYYLTLSFFIIFSLSSFAFAQEMKLSKDPAREKIHVTADSLSSESNARFAEFKGNVKVTQGDFIIKSDSLKILYKESGGEKKAGTTESIEKIIASGNVKIESEEMTAVSQQAEYDTNTMIMVLTGEDSKVFDKKNSVTGSKITFNRKDGLMKAEGDSKRRVNAVFFPDEKTTPKKGSEKTEAVYTAAATGTVSEKAKISDTRKAPESPVKSPAPEKSLSVLKEEKKPLIQAKADIQPQAAPVNVVFVPAVVEKAKVSEPVIQKISHGTLIKSVGIASVENKTGNSSIDFQEDMQRQLSGALGRSCSGLQLFQAGDEKFPPDFVKLPRMVSGSIDSFRICETGRKSGLSAIITGFVAEIKTGEEPRGILWYRDSYPFISISVHFDVYDTETGAKLLDESFNYKRDSDELEIESVKAGKIETLLLKDAFEHISKDAGRKVCEIMKRQSWKGYVSSVSGDKISISSGRNTGIVPGNVFEVYGNNLLEGKDGQKFYIPGPKAGVIKITAVNKESSEAVIVTGDSVKIGYTIRAK
ncbi:MAG: lipopolysaccharide transport periplasmic protein LptA [Proteobacteria bacterium]|nr:lipopolysaccharide transport periplasmic protein LptA [Pseudomonadota bacterium]